jgi:hypothetical protein
MIGFGLFGLKFWYGILHLSPQWFIAWGWHLPRGTQGSD